MKDAGELDLVHSRTRKLFCCPAEHLVIKLTWAAHNHDFRRDSDLVFYFIFEHVSFMDRSVGH